MWVRRGPGVVAGPAGDRQRAAVRGGFAEGLTDRQAADAVRGRIDVEYALGLELEDPGFGFSVLSEFRDRLIGHGLEELVLPLAQVSARTGRK